MEGQGKTWEEVPDEIKRTFDKLGIPEAERKFLAGVGAQYDSEVVYHKIREDLEKLGVHLPRHGHAACASTTRSCGSTSVPSCRPATTSSRR